MYIFFNFFYNGNMDLISIFDVFRKDKVLLVIIK